MSASANDPFILLSKAPVPEPDEARIEANVRASRDAFVRNRQPAARMTTSPGWRSALRRRGFWRPAAAGLAAVAALAAIIVLPGRMQSPNIGPAPSEQVAQAPVLLTAPDADNKAPARMGARPAPRQSIEAIPSPSPRIDELTQTRLGALRLGYRFLGDIVELYRIDGEALLRMERRRLGPGGQLALLDAAVMDDGRTIAVRSRLNLPGGRKSETVWDVYVQDNGAYRFDQERTVMIEGARDAAEAMKRLADAAR